jgi:hypothetical protein
LRSALLAAGFDQRAVLVHNIGPDLADQNRSTIYPAIYLYAARMENLRLRFGAFAGPLRLVADLRSTGERYDHLERDLTSLVERVTAALASRTGSWGEGLIYSGAYAVKFEPIRLGGRNFIQSAKIEIEIEACG